jgi:hypothetical protein
LRLHEYRHVRHRKVLIHSKITVVTADIISSVETIQSTTTTPLWGVGTDQADDLKLVRGQGAATTRNMQHKSGATRGGDVHVASTQLTHSGDKENTGLVPREQSSVIF